MQNLQDELNELERGRDLNRRRFLTRWFGIFSLSSAFLVAKDHDKLDGNRKRNREEEEHDNHDPRHFRHEDYGVIEHYYNGPRNLPPGLRKKYYRTGTLPPGWQKKLQPFPPDLVRRLPPPPPGSERGYIDGVAVVYDRKTRVILDSIDLIAAVAGH